MKIQKISRKPDKWKPLAFLFAILSVGSTAETSRIFTSSDADIVNNRPWLNIMALIITAVFVFLTVWFWRRSANTKRL